MSPRLWPFSWYNTRYGIAVLVFLRLAAGALADVLPAPRKAICLGHPLLVRSRRGLCIHPMKTGSAGKSRNRIRISRRAWTALLRVFFESHYKTGEGILSGFGDLGGYLLPSRYPSESKSLTKASGPDWLIETSAPAKLFIR